MAVIDHPVHERVRIGADWRYACFNRPDKFADGYWAPDRKYYPDGRWENIQTWVPFTMSHECRSDDSTGFCNGCRHHLVSDYVQQIIKASAPAVKSPNPNLNDASLGVGISMRTAAG